MINKENEYLIKIDNELNRLIELYNKYEKPDITKHETIKELIKDELLNIKANNTFKNEQNQYFNIIDKLQNNQIEHISNLYFENKKNNIQENINIFIYLTNKDIELLKPIQNELKKHFIELQPQEIIKYLIYTSLNIWYDFESVVIEQEEQTYNKKN